MNRGDFIGPGKCFETEEEEFAEYIELQCWAASVGPEEVDRLLDAIEEFLDNA